ncbi:uncharacterized protein LOC115986837 isoform X2 [Quercus lobata]|uniref:uncharacterized protein LOC115986837 isoform X2 n=1 Tax=Quercus lobata TaxID=97700 RepID=UPI00124440F1|nr:uncharacterized protein LOC115986837 isoform X2 [Quercus lobata]
MVMDFPLDDSGATAFSSSSSSSPFLHPNCLAGFAGDSRSLSPRRTVLSKISKRSSATLIFAASNAMGNCQTRLEQSPEAHHGPHLMRKILVSALKRSSKLLSRRVIHYGQQVGAEFSTTK